MHRTGKRSADHLKQFQYKAGEEWTGNAGGRPKRDLASEIAQEIFEQNRELIKKGILLQLKKGNPKSFAVNADRAFGRLPVNHNIGGADGGPLKAIVTVVFEKPGGDSSSS